jgi:(R,R)-butanediol dehydrogenase / meso-butanediol dehydrogenase / diacetyl reductase
MRTVKAVVYEGAEKISVKEMEITDVREGWALIKISFCGICGTDLNIYSGNHPRAQAGLIIGHEFSGTIVSHSTLKEGTPVTALPLISCGQCEPCQTGQSHICEKLGLYGIDQAGGMAEYVLIPETEIFALPEELSLKRTALVEPFAVAVHAVRVSDFKPGDSVTVFGAGPIGVCTAIVLNLFGASSVKVVEKQPYRSEIAQSMGFEVIDPTVGEIPQADVVFDCAAHPSVAEKLVAVTKVSGQIVLVGTYKFPTQLDLQNITFKELSVKGTRVYTKKDYDVAIALLEKDYDFEKMITHVYPSDEAAEAFTMLASGGDCVKALISF